MKQTLILSLFFSLSVLAHNDKRTVTIDKNNEGGFNIYNNSGELIYEYTEQNADSSTLKTLNDIFIEAELVNDKLAKVEIVNIPQDSFWNKYAPYFSVLVGVFFGWLFSHYSQRKLIREQFKLQQKKDWFSDFFNISNEFKASSFHFKTAKIYWARNWLRKTPEKNVHTNEDLIKYVDDLSNKALKLSAFLDSEDKEQNNLILLLTTFLETIGTSAKSEDELDILESTIEKLTNKIDTSLRTIKKIKQNELNNL